MPRRISRTAARRQDRVDSDALHVADTHDLIRVRGAPVNNLKDISVEIPKRRLTVFTGVSGSGKSSLAFGTIAAEAKRMINETYSDGAGAAGTPAAYETASSSPASRSTSSSTSRPTWAPDPSLRLPT